mmetsp:Transcript_4223/g.9471  ORF Transcript_4223/g.9471 Transcript_4223/m.9471 type:complete len:247 (-) Transcript_4223:87-827(-)
MEGASDGQGQGHSRTHLGGDLQHRRTGLLGPRHCVVAVHQVVGDADGLSGLGGRFVAYLLHGLLAQPDDRHHARLTRIRRSLHGLASGFGEAHPVLEGEGACEAQSRVLAEAEAHGDGAPAYGLWVVRLELLQRSHGGHEYGGLADDRAVQGLLGAIGALGQQVVSEDLRGRVEQRLGCGHLAAQTDRHAHALRPLAGKHEAHLVAYCGHGELCGEAAHGARAREPAGLQQPQRGSHHSCGGEEGE